MRYRPACVDELIDLGDRIDALRSKLGDAPNALHARFMAARGQPGENDVGEPRKAQAWLSELDR